MWLSWSEKKEEDIYKQEVTVFEADNLLVKIVPHNNE